MSNVFVVGSRISLAAHLDNDAEFAAPTDMLSEPYEDERALTSRMRSIHALWDDAGRNVANRRDGSAIRIRDRYLYLPERQFDHASQFHHRQLAAKNLT